MNWRKMMCQYCGSIARLPRPGFGCAPAIQSSFSLIGGTKHAIPCLEAPEVLVLCKELCQPVQGPAAGSRKGRVPDDADQSILGILRGSQNPGTTSSTLCIAVTLGVRHAEDVKNRHPRFLDVKIGKSRAHTL